MKILVLMPLDERMVYNCGAIFKELPQEIKEITFAMPMFMDYLITTHEANNWLFALYDALYAEKALYNAAEAGDFIVLGNAPKDLQSFDAVFNFQDAEADKPYEDNFIKKIKEIVAEEPILLNMINNLYEASDSKLALKNCQATANFLTDYIKTEPDLKSIKEKYKDILKFKEGDE